MLSLAEIRGRSMAPNGVAPFPTDTTSKARRGRYLAYSLVIACLIAGPGIADPGDSAPPPATTANADGQSGDATGDQKSTDLTEADWSLWESADTPAPWQTSGTSPWWVLGRVLLALVLVGSLVILLLVLLRRYGIGSGPSGVGAPRLQLLASLSLAPRRTVYLVRVDGVELLVGTAGDGLRLLTELPGVRDAALQSMSTATGGNGVTVVTPPAPATPATATATPVSGQSPPVTASFLSAFSRLLGTPTGGESSREAADG